MSNNGGLSGNGGVPKQRELSEAESIDALEAGHTFPGYFPIVVIARQSDVFLAELETAMAEVQGDAPYSINERPSRKGNFVSYRVEVHVESARDALARREVLGGLNGVLMLL